MLLSVSREKEIILWLYQNSRKVDRFTKNEDILCVEYISDINEPSGTLLLGADSGDILPHDIVKYICFLD